MSSPSLRHGDQQGSYTMTTSAQTLPLPVHAKRQQPPTDEQRISPDKKMNGKKTDMRSGEYLLKSGLAGGLAGCAVCLLQPPPVSKEGYIILTLSFAIGKNRSRSSRSRQDSPSNKQSQFPKVRRALDRLAQCHPGHLRCQRFPRTLQRTLRNTPPHLSIRWHKVPRIRADPCPSHQDQSRRNSTATFRIRQLGGCGQRLLYLPLGSDSRPVSLRDPISAA